MIGTANVTGAFVRRGSVVQATLRVGRTPGLRFGHTTILFRTINARGQRGYNQVSFVLARAAGGLMSAVAGRPVRGQGAAVRLGLARRGLRVRVWANGRSTAVRGGSPDRVLSLDADNGLRPGVNSVLVRALDAHTGVYQLRRLRLFMPTGAAVAGAGPSRRARVGDTVRASAGASKAPSGGGRLRYRWTIVARPRGSRARLRDANRVRPVLRPDRPGRYVLQVTVTPAPGSVKPTARVGRAGLLSSANASSDTMSIQATPPTPYLGLPIDTIATQGGKLGVFVSDGLGDGGNFYSPTPTNPAAALQLLVLDRGSLAMQENESFTNDANGAGLLLAAVQGLPNSDLVIITKPSAAVTNTSSTDSGATVNKALASIGAPPVNASVITGTDNCATSDPCDAFSAIGVAGTSTGGVTNAGLADMAGAGNPPGDLHGYLQEDLGSDSYVFANTERVPFDTGNPAANPAVVTVGGSPLAQKQYTSAQLSQPGFFVVVLDAGSLAFRQQGTFTAANTGPNDLQDLYTMLETYVADPTAVVIMRSVGSVRRVPGLPNQIGYWDKTSYAIQQLGGSLFYFNALNGTSSQSYAMVAPGANPGIYPAPWTQVASRETSDAGRLSGLLARNPSSQYYPDEASPAGTPLSQTLSGLISLPSVAWPDRSTVSEQNALACIAKQLDLNYPIESNYTNENLQSNWVGYAGTLTDPRFPGHLAARTDCMPYSASDLTAIIAQLDQEWTAVPLVWQMIHNMEQPYNGPAASTADLQSIAAQVNENVGTGGQNVSYDGEAIASDALWVLSTLPGFSEFADPLNFLAGGLGIADGLTVGENGTPALADVSTTAASLGASLESQYEDNINGLERAGDIFVQDWNKLQAAATNALGPWQWNATIYAKADDELEIAAARLAYRTLFPVRYDLYRVSAGTGSLNPQDVTPYLCQSYDFNNGTITTPYYPFAKVPRYGGDAPTVDAEGAAEQWVYAGPDSLFVTNPAYTNQAQFPPEDLLQNMFVSQPNFGLNAPLFNPLQFPLTTYNNTTSNTIGVTHIQFSKQGQSSNNVCQATPASS
jgi:hypothetical protein